MSDGAAPSPIPGLDPASIDETRHLLDLLDLIAAERQRLHGGDEQGAVVRLLLRQMIGGDDRGMPLLRLAKLTGCPRETLRRKLGPLLNRGYLVQDEAGRYRCGAAYFTDSASARQRILDALRQFLPPAPRD
ncbi:helix-turn-helix domain-containing protein [Zavarzinia aquatilis]|uniref:HTH iclR-type domain-containing protein n=1 Tax=Zavarzinia aquatilis TaxID=2211142 RepID=A0A317E8L9_9PROT|nr:hypothetical protein [Zavarzinia aquatilis]PWR22902.1 hypothetical protein DKG74_10815 [Zavarzinia aquatilis]